MIAAMKKEDRISGRVFRQVRVRSGDGARESAHRCKASFRSTAKFLELVKSRQIQLFNGNEGTHAYLENTRNCR